MKTIMVTGASGFVGAALCTELIQRGHAVVAVVRRIDERRVPAVTYIEADLADLASFADGLPQVDCIVHLAGRAHMLNDKAADPLALFREINRDASVRLAERALQAGVKRFVFISSIGVNGNINTRPFTPNDRINPAEPYAQSKWEAEQGLWKIQHATGMELVIIRPPLVYGSGAPGNFGSLMRWIDKGVPLPLGAINNKRSLVGIDNLVDLIIRCIDHPAAANQVFLAGDGEDLSTTELLRGVAEAMGRPARLIPVPAGLLSLGVTLLGKRVVAQRLLGSLQVDISKTRQLLGWEPPVSVKEGLRRCVRDSSD
ncbi:UDP-glucose 4-epimerase family protein [Ectopseudomonas mendocina]